jgi:chromosome segregation ATPase
VSLEQEVAKLRNQTEQLQRKLDEQKARELREKTTAAREISALKDSEHKKTEDIACAKQKLKDLSDKVQSYKEELDVEKNSNAELNGELKKLHKQHYKTITDLTIEKNKTITDLTIENHALSGELKPLQKHIREKERELEQERFRNVEQTGKLQQQDHRQQHADSEIKKILQLTSAKRKTKYSICRKNSNA